MNLNSKWSNVIKNLNPKIFEESEQHKYFREKLDSLAKLNMSNYIDLMKKYTMKAASFDGIDMNEFDRDINELLEQEKIRLFQDPLVKAVIELKSKRIAAQQKRRMNSYGRWSKMMRDKYKQ